MGRPISLIKYKFFRLWMVQCRLSQLTTKVAPTAHSHCMLFAHDPVATSFGDGLWRGEIRLFAREMGTGNMPYSLEEVQQAGQPASLAIAAEYPQDLVLVGIPR